MKVIFRCEELETFRVGERFGVSCEHSFFSTLYIGGDIKVSLWLDNRTGGDEWISHEVGSIWVELGSSFGNLVKGLP